MLVSLLAGACRAGSHPSSVTTSSDALRSDTTVGTESVHWRVGAPLPVAASEVGIAKASNSRRGRSKRRLALHVAALVTWSSSIGLWAPARCVP